MAQRDSPCFVDPPHPRGDCGHLSPGDRRAGEAFSIPGPASVPGTGPPGAFSASLTLSSATAADLRFVLAQQPRPKRACALPSGPEERACTTAPRSRASLRVASCREDPLPSCRGRRALLPPRPQGFRAFVSDLEKAPGRGVRGSCWAPTSATLGTLSSLLRKRAWGGGRLPSCPGLLAD